MTANSILTVIFSIFGFVKLKKKLKKIIIISFSNNEKMTVKIDLTVIANNSDIDC